jgi:hypothetical protein
MKVGLMCGREFSFPPAFLEHVNKLGHKDGVTAEFVKLGGTKMGELAEYRVIVDRISHEVEYYRGYLKHAVLQGTYVINNPSPQNWDWQFPKPCSCRKKATHRMLTSIPNPSAT